MRRMWYNQVLVINSPISAPQRRTAAVCRRGGVAKLNTYTIKKEGTYMSKKQFKAESKRMLDLMINSIYTHKEIFLRDNFERIGRH